MKKYLFFTGLISLLLVMFFAACPMDSDDGSKVDKYTSTGSDGKTYVLEITDGKTYVLTIKDTDGKTVTSSGTVESEAGGEIILKPTTGDNITVAVPDGQMTGIAVAGGGEISVTDEEGETVTVTPPEEVESKDDPKPDTSGGGSVSETNAQVYWADGKQYTGNGTVRVLYWPEDGPSEVVGTVGTVTGGKLTLNLTSSIPSRYLVKASDWTAQTSGITVTPSDVLLFTSSSFYLFYDESSNQYNGIHLEKNTGNTDDSVQYMYFSKAARITGTVSYTYEADRETTVTATQTLDMDVKGGWNKVYISSTRNGNKETATVTTNLSNLPSGLTWTIPRDSPSGDDSGDNNDSNNNGGNGDSGPWNGETSLGPGYVLGTSLHYNQAVEFQAGGRTIQHYLISDSSYDAAYNIFISSRFVLQSGKVLLQIGSSLSNKSPYLIVEVNYNGSDTSGAPSEVRLVSRSSDGTIKGTLFYPPQNSGNGDNGSGSGSGGSDSGNTGNSGNNSGGGTLAGAKGKLTLTGFNEFNGKYVYSGLVTKSGNKYLYGMNGADSSGNLSMVQISGGKAEVPLYTLNTGATSVADLYVPYDGNDEFLVVAILIVDDSDGKFTYTDTSFATNYVGSIGSNFMNASFTPRTNNGSIVIDRSDVKTVTDAGLADAKYILTVR
jgi:hypothetical protein